ncbi:hypothetical protein N0V90_012289 [Kalmusia sp. IMI 367209]|nr:hypothetical protein N0V90_012289 [Kalmusia sp. IMI 367209]
MASSPGMYIAGAILKDRIESIGNLYSGQADSSLANALLLDLHCYVSQDLNSHRNDKKNVVLAAAARIDVNKLSQQHVCPVQKIERVRDWILDDVIPFVENFFAPDDEDEDMFYDLEWPMTTSKLVEWLQKRLFSILDNKRTVDKHFVEVPRVDLRDLVEGTHMLCQRLPDLFGQAGASTAYEEQDLFTLDIPLRQAEELRNAVHLSQAFDFSEPLENQQVGPQTEGINLQDDRPTNGLDERKLTRRERAQARSRFDRESNHLRKTVLLASANRVEGASQLSGTKSLEQDPHPPNSVSHGSHRSHPIQSGAMSQDAVQHAGSQMQNTTRVPRHALSSSSGNGNGTKTPNANGLVRSTDNALFQKRGKKAKEQQGAQPAVRRSKTAHLLFIRVERERWGTKYRFARNEWMKWLSIVWKQLTDDEGEYFEILAREDRAREISEQSYVAGGYTVDQEASQQYDDALIELARLAPRAQAALDAENHEMYRPEPSNRSAGAAVGKKQDADAKNNQAWENTKQFVRSTLGAFHGGEISNIPATQAPRTNQPTISPTAGALPSGLHPADASVTVDSEEKPADSMHETLMDVDAPIEISEAERNREQQQYWEQEFAQARNMAGHGRPRLPPPNNAGSGALDGDNINNPIDLATLAEDEDSDDDSDDENTGAAALGGDTSKSKATDSDITSPSGSTCDDECFRHIADIDNTRGEDKADSVAIDNEFVDNVDENSDWDMEEDIQGYEKVVAGSDTDT